MRLMRNYFIAFLLLIASSYAQSLALAPPGYAVSSAHPLATNAGLAVLAQGGNAFDAAVAVAAVLAVVEPYHTSIGGGGFWLLHQEATHKNIFIDSREKAPLAATEKMFLDSSGKVVPGLSLNGGLAAAIPGQPAAFVYIAEQYGRLPLKVSLAPAIQLAQEGFVVDKQFKYFTIMDDRLAMLRKYPATAAIFLKKQRPYEIGERLIQKDLAATLTLLAQQGRAGFYEGKIAKRLVKGVNKAGGIWSLNDLKQYNIKVREPLIGAYHNMLVITAPPPSAGGVSLLTMLNILAQYPLSTLSKEQWVHHIVEAMRLAYWQREEFLGDPDFVKIPIEQLISAQNAKQLASLIRSDKVIDSKKLQGPASTHGNHPNTTHFSILDAQGNRVAATLTVNFIFGSSVVADGTGVLLNDEMDDFSSAVGSANVFGLVGNDLNKIAPGKRPTSSMTPTFLETPDRIAILGTPGGSRIPSMILLSSLLFYEGYGAISLVSSMRFHHQYLPDLLQFEPDSFPDTLQKSLLELGYQLMPLTQYYGNMQAITWDKKTSLLTASSDPRNIGLSAVVANKKTGYGVKY